MKNVVELGAGAETQRMLVMLDDMRERVVAGEVRALGLVAVSGSKEISTGWHCVTTGYHSSVVGALGYLQHRMHQHMDAQD